MQKVRDQQERERSYRAVVHLADKRFVQLATPDLPTVNAGDDPAQRDRHVRHALSPGDLLGPGPTTTSTCSISRPASRRRCSSTGATPRRCSPGGKYVLHFDERRPATGSRYRVVGRRARQPHREDSPAKFQQENNTPDLPGAYGAGGWTADDKSVLLYDKFDIWEVKPDGTGARMITERRGRKQEIDVPLSLARSRRATVVPANKPLAAARRSNDRTRATGFYRIASLTATAAPEKVVMLDKAFGARDEGEERRHRRLHALALRGVPGSVGQRHARSRT